MHVASFHQNEARKIEQAIPVGNFFIEDSPVYLHLSCLSACGDSGIRFSGDSEATDLLFSVFIAITI